MGRSVAAAFPLCVVLLGLPAKGSPETVDQVVARYLRARGGIDKIRGVQTLRLTGTMTLSDVEAPLVLELKRPDRMRTEFVFQGKTAVRVYDGRNAWMVLPVPGLDQPRPMSPEDARDAREQADIDLSPLVDHAAKGYTVELVGREAALGKESWKLRVRTRDDQVRTMYLDARTYLVTRTEETRTVEGKEEEFVTVIGDYRPIGGLVYPHTIEVRPRKGGEAQRFAFARIEINVPIDDSRFTMPAARH